MSKCKHKNTDAGPMSGYTGSVATRHYTQEERRAHGGVSYTRTCTDCGATRRENSNGRYTEVSAWTRATK